MKSKLLLLLKTILCLTAIGIVTGMIWFPQTEGRATNLNMIDIYTDPLIIYGYISLIPFFIGLYQILKLFNLIDSNKFFSKNSVDILRKIRKSSISLITLIGLALVYIRFFVQGDDPAGPTMLGICISVLLLLVVMATYVLERFARENLNAE